jgi:hypothetical protein
MAEEPRFPIRINPSRGKRSDSDIAVTFTFPDETIAVITFSAKGHTFEGVRESLSAHRGDCLIAMEDYKRLSIHVGARKRELVNRYRDHGHARNIVDAYRNSSGGGAYDRAASALHIANTGWLFLKTREALESNTELTIDAYPQPVTE